MPLLRGEAEIASWPLRNLQPALHRRPREAALQPRRDVLEIIEADEIARAIKADQIAHPAERCDVRNGVLLAHDPLLPGKARLKNAEQAFCFGGIAIARALVLKILAGELVEEADLAEHRPDAAHLEVHPGDCFPAPGRIGRNELAGFLGEILEDRTGLEQSKRLAAGAIRIDDRGNLAVRI